MTDTAEACPRCQAGTFAIAPDGTRLCGCGSRWPAPAPEPVYRLSSRTAGDVVTTHDPATCDECWDCLVAARMIAAMFPLGRPTSARGDHVAEWHPHQPAPT